MNEQLAWEASDARQRWKGVRETIQQTHRECTILLAPDQVNRGPDPGVQRVGLVDRGVVK